MGKLTSFVRGTLKKLKSKSALAAVAVVIAASVAGVYVKSAQAERADCDGNAVLYCGAYDTNTLINKYNSSSSARSIYAASPFGISNSEFQSIAGAKVGYVTSGNTVVVDGKVVATNAVTAGRSYMSGSQPLNGAPGYSRAPSVSFKQGSLSAFVKLDANGRFQFAVIRACGNPVVGNPTTPPKPPKPTPKPSFKVEKKVRLAGTKDQFKENINVKTGQKVEYAIAVQNTGDTQLTGVRVRDALPASMSYVSGSSYMITSYDGKHGLPNGVTGKGVGIGRIPKNGTTFVFFSATAPKASNTNLVLCSKGKSKLRNIAYAKPVGLAEKNNDANIYTCRPDQPKFEIAKKVRKADTSDEFKKDVTAAPGTKVEYVISVKNTGLVDIKDILVKDNLPTGVSYIPGSATLTISGGVNGQKVDDKLVTTGFKIPVLKKGATAFVFFKSTLPTAENPIVKDCKVGKTKLTNKAHVDPVGPLGPLEDTANAYTCKTVNTPVPNFEIVKDVRKMGDTAWKQDVTVKYGDSVEYKITVKNTGETDLKNVLVKDARPTGVDYMNGTLKVNGQSSNADLFGAGVTIPEIKKDAIAEITFEAKVASVKPDLCEDANFRNIASALPEGLTKKEDDAVVKAECLPFNPRVDIEKTVSKTVVDVNGQFVYTLIVTNNGDVDLTKVKVTDPAPEGVQFISSTKPDGTTVNLTPTNFEAVIAKLAQGQKVTFDIVSKVTKEMPTGTTNTACVDAPEVPGNPDDCDSIIIKTPKYECRSLNALSLGELKYRFSVLVNKTEDVQLNSVSYNFGDGTETVTVNSQAPVEHQYLQTEDETTYKAIATVKFSVGGEVKESVCETEVTIAPIPDEVCPYNPNLPKDSPDCVEPCPYDENLPKDSPDCKPPETPVTPPTSNPTQPPVNVVPNTGTSGVAAGVIGSSASVYALYAWIESRRALKQK